MSTPTRWPRVIRHDKSGVWICYLLGEGDVPGMLRIEGRRVWSWSGGRLETSQLATQGARLGDKLGDWVTNDLPIGDLVDVTHTTEEIVEHCRSLPRFEP